MSVTISEGYQSRGFTLAAFTGQAGRELTFDVQGTEDEEVVRTTLLAAAPAVYLGRIIDSIDAEPLGGGVWKCHARYIRFDNQNEYTFETGGGTEKVTQSYATARYGTDAPDFQGAIGVSDDKVEGVDVDKAVFNFTETHVLSQATVTSAYKHVLFLMTNRVNNATFKGFNAGECRFLGASGTLKGDENWSIAYRFAGSENVTGQTVGTITGIDKKGWQYRWVRYADYKDGSAQALVKRPVGVYVEDVYLTGDFSTLGIGV